MLDVCPTHEIGYVCTVWNNIISYYACSFERHFAFRAFESTRRGDVNFVRYTYVFGPFERAERRLAVINRRAGIVGGGWFSADDNNNNNNIIMQKKGSKTLCSFRRRGAEGRPAARARNKRKQQAN